MGLKTLAKKQCYPKISFFTIALPDYVTQIVGYSPSRHRTYFKGTGDMGITSSVDGSVLELASNILPGDIIYAVGVPGNTNLALGTKTWTGASFSYYGTISLFKICNLRARLHMTKSLTKNIRRRRILKFIFKFVIFSFLCNF